MTIYLDYQATTPVDPMVLSAMLPYFSHSFGNAASRTHSFGQQAEEAVERSRQQVATLIGAEPREITWTSGATEAINLALKGLALARREKGDHLVTVATEHKATLDTLKWLESQGFKVTCLPVDRTGAIDEADLEKALTPRTILVSMMHANNEVGTIHDIAAAGRMTSERGIPLHVDAAQSLGRVPIDLKTLPVDLMSFSAHKLYGPKGAGALFVRRKEEDGIHPVPLIHGGGHEHGLRSGTLNVPAIVGFGAACELAGQVMAEENIRLKRLRDRLLRGIREQLDDVYVNGSPVAKLTCNLNLSFEGVESEPLIIAMKEIAVSSGSACTSASPEPSHVLRAMGVPDNLAHGSVRFSVGRYTTEQDIQAAIDAVVRGVRKLRSISKQYALGSAS